MKGFVPTPEQLVDVMIMKLFRGRHPTRHDRLLDPGCGTGAFIQGVIRWCRKNRCEVPAIVGIDSDPRLIIEAGNNVGDHAQVMLVNEDFLTARRDRFDFVVGNPPYVPITGLTPEEREAYRRNYDTAVGRFDLYLLFFEQALGMLRPSGRLVLITPEKFLYTQTAEPLRSRLAQFAIEEVQLLAESAFRDLTTYPTITTVVRETPGRKTKFVRRDGTINDVQLKGGSSWLPTLHGVSMRTPRHTIGKAFARVSCGIATGADNVFVVKTCDLPQSLEPFAHPTVSGRSLRIGEGFEVSHSMLVPYDSSGSLFPEENLGALGEYLRQENHKARLLRRSCVSRKPWYAFHETPPMASVLTPKILCKDIGARPWFVIDERGDILPRHSVYYLVPVHPEQIQELCDYLNSARACKWLVANSQRAANGFIRLQSHVLKRLPIPHDLIARPSPVPA